MSRRKPPKEESQPPVDPMMSAEGIIRDLHRLIEGQNFESPEELEGFLARTVGAGPLPHVPAATPLDEAQDLIYAAAEERSSKRRTELAQRALQLSADCADAYALLAGEATTMSAARELFALGVAAAKRALGADWDRLAADHALWLAIEGRPYMRARAGFASASWECGDRQLAIAEAWGMLELVPDDNLGVRYTLIGWLLFAGSIAEIDRLLALYPDDQSATWLYSRALHEFRLYGASQQANAKLRAALRVNPHVPAYVLGQRPLPLERPEYVGWGDESEAVAYTYDCELLWADAAGSLEWLARQSSGRARPRDRQPKRGR